MQSSLFSCILIEFTLSKIRQEESKIHCLVCSRFPPAPVLRRV